MAESSKDRRISKATRLILLFCFGSLAYMLIEIGFRGYTHWTMGIVGGLCFLIIGALNENFTYQIPIWEQCVLGSIVITVLEFIAGVILNIWLKLNIWDYSDQWGNLLGQICPLFSFLWIFISGIAIWLDDLLRWALFKEEFPHYKWF